MKKLDEVIKLSVTNIKTITTNKERLYFYIQDNAHKNGEMVLSNRAGCREVFNVRLTDAIYNKGVGSHNEDYSYPEVKELKDPKIYFILDTTEFNALSNNLKVLHELEDTLEIERTIVNYYQTNSIDLNIVEIHISNFWSKSLLTLNTLTIILRDLTLNTLLKEISLNNYLNGNIRYLRNPSDQLITLKRSTQINNFNLDLLFLLKNSDYILKDNPITGIDDSLYTKSIIEQKSHYIFNFNNLVKFTDNDVSLCTKDKLRIIDPILIKPNTPYYIGLSNFTYLLNNITYLRNNNPSGSFGLSIMSQWAIRYLELKGE